MSGLSKRQRWILFTVFLVAETVFVALNWPAFSEMLMASRVAFGQLALLFVGVAALAGIAARYAIWRRERGTRDA